MGDGEKRGRGDTAISPSPLLPVSASGLVNRGYMFSRRREQQFSLASADR